MTTSRFAVTVAAVLALAAPAHAADVVGTIVVESLVRFPSGSPVPATVGARASTNYVASNYASENPVAKPVPGGLSLTFTIPYRWPVTAGRTTARVGVTISNSVAGRSSTTTVTIPLPKGGRTVVAIPVDL